MYPDDLSHFSSTKHLVANAFSARLRALNRLTLQWPAQRWADALVCWSKGVFAPASVYKAGDPELRLPCAYIETSGKDGDFLMITAEGVLRGFHGEFSVEVQQQWLTPNISRADADLLRTMLTERGHHPHTVRETLQLEISPPAVWRTDLEVQRFPYMNWSDLCDQRQVIPAFPDQATFFQWLDNMVVRQECIPAPLFFATLTQSEEARKWLRSAQDWEVLSMRLSPFVLRQLDDLLMLPCETPAFVSWLLAVGGQDSTNMTTLSRMAAAGKIPASMSDSYIAQSLQAWKNDNVDHLLKLQPLIREPHKMHATFCAHHPPGPLVRRWLWQQHSKGTRTKQFVDLTQEVAHGNPQLEVEPQWLEALWHHAYSGRCTVAEFPKRWVDPFIDLQITAPTPLPDKALLHFIAPALPQLDKTLGLQLVHQILTRPQITHGDTNTDRYHLFSFCHQYWPELAHLWDMLRTFDRPLAQWLQAIEALINGESNPPLPVLES